MKILKVKVHPGKNITKKLNKVSRKDIDMEVELKAKAENSEANIELIKFLANEMNIPVENVKIISGLKSRIKNIKIL